MRGMLKARIRRYRERLTCLAAILTISVGAFAAAIPDHTAQLVLGQMLDSENGLAVDGVHSIKTNGVWGWRADRILQTRDGGETWKELSSSLVSGGGPIVWQHGCVHLSDKDIYEVSIARLPNGYENRQTYSIGTILNSVIFLGASASWLRNR